MLILKIRPQISQLGSLRSLCRAIHWPACPNPSPYQIFGLDAGTPAIDKKQLRKIYYDLVKTYHPDRGTTGDAERFKRVVEAHNILRDDSRRRTYDASRVYSSGTASDATADGVRYRRTSHFEDDMDVNYWSNANQQRFDEGLRESRMWVLKCVVFVTVVIAIGNMILLKQAAETRSEMMSAQTERTAAQLAKVQANRYPDDTPQDIIERFVENRQRTLDRYGGQVSYKTIRDGRIISPEVSSTNFDSNDAGSLPPKQKRPANGEHEGPVAAYFGR